MKKKTDLEILMGVHVFISPECKKETFLMFSLSLCMHVRTLLAPVRLDELDSFWIFKGWCSVNVIILAPKQWHLRWSPKKNSFS
jgi:hypothetical protein